MVANFWGKKGEENNSPATHKVLGVDEAPKETPALAPVATASESRSVFSDLVERRGLAEPGTADNALERRFGSIRAALSTGTVLQGKLSFDTHVRIDGQVKGEVFCSRALIVGPSGRVDARIDAGTLIVLGRVTGFVSVRERIEILAGGVLEGEVQTPVFVVEDGALFNGKCQMLSAIGEISPAGSDAEDDSPAE